MDIRADEGAPLEAFVAVIFATKRRKASQIQVAVENRRDRQGG